MARRRLVCFDVNETILDLAALDEVFEPLGGGRAREAWFLHLLLMAQATSLAGYYEDFSRLAIEALEGVAARGGWRLDADLPSRLRSALSVLPAHADAQTALTRLGAAGYRLLALTNSATGTADGPLARAGLASSFDAILSVDAVRRYKPAPEPYQMAAGHFGVTTDEMWMVAAHDWDVLGAMAAGCGSIFVARSGGRFPACWPPPHAQVASLEQAAEAIVTLDSEDRR